MQHKLYGLKGKAYVAEYKRLYKVLKEDIKKDFFAIAEETGNFTALDLGKLCNKYLIPVKVMDEWLEDVTLEETKILGQFYPSGTWERCRGKGIKARDIGVVWK